MTRLACYLSMLLIIGLHSPGLAATAKSSGQIRIHGRLQTQSSVTAGQANCSVTFNLIYQ